MKILMVADFFYPEITPRANRVTELAQEFCRLGHSVSVVVPNKEIYRRHPLSIANLEIVYADQPEVKNGHIPSRKRIRKILPEFITRGFLYFYNHEYFIRYNKGIEKSLCSLEGDFDLLISFSYPVAIHRAVISALNSNSKITVRHKFAEFSDPPMRNENNTRLFPLYNLFLHRAGKYFDRFVIPVENALPCYTSFKNRAEISVIPQGFDNSGIVLKRYLRNHVPTFAFAGRFYRNTRDPEPLFKYLAASAQDFVFHLYLTEIDDYFSEMVKRYSSISKGRIEVHTALPRKELIAELSAMDFIVNQNFTYSTATPSKLIDYAVAKRPVYSFDGNGFDPAVFEKFLAGDYSGSFELPDVQRYDIANIAQEFLSLAQS